MYTAEQLETLFAEIGKLYAENCRLKFLLETANGEVISGEIEEKPEEKLEEKLKEKPEKKLKPTRAKKVKEEKKEGDEALQALRNKLKEAMK